MKGVSHHNTAKGALFLALIGSEFGGVVRVGVPAATQLGRLLFPLLDLLHVSTAALVMLRTEKSRTFQKRDQKQDWKTNRNDTVDMEGKSSKLPSFESSSVAPPWPPAEQHSGQPGAPHGLCRKHTHTHTL